MSDRGIIFSAPMVRALLAGTKTQTRRAPKWQPYPAVKNFALSLMPGIHRHGDVVWPLGLGHDIVSNKLGPHPEWTVKHVKFAVGDTLWVREAWKAHSTFAGVPPRDIPPSTIFYAADDAYAPSNTPWRSPIHMPRWASRLTLAITDVRVEHLKEITDEDALAEGVGPRCQPDPARPDLIWVGSPLVCKAPTLAYRDLWNSIHGPGAWDTNPWVCALTFTVDRRNIDAPAVAKMEEAA